MHVVKNVSWPFGTFCSQNCSRLQAALPGAPSIAITVDWHRSKRCIYFKVFFFLHQGPFCGVSDCGVHWLPQFCTLCDPPHGFQSQGGSLACILTCLHVVNVRVTSGATPAFSTNRGEHYISSYTTDSPSRHPSNKQWRTGNGGLGSSEIRTRKP